MNVISTTMLDKVKAARAPFDRCNHAFLRSRMNAHVARCTTTCKSNRHYLQRCCWTALLPFRVWTRTTSSAKSNYVVRPPHRKYLEKSLKSCHPLVRCPVLARVMDGPSGWPFDRLSITFLYSHIFHLRITFQQFQFHILTNLLRDLIIK